MFSIEQLLIPISVMEPCGADLSFSVEVDAIARARQRDDPALDQGEWTVALKEADWPFVAAQCAQLIQARSKDLKLAVWLAEASARTGSFRGLADGFGLLAGLCDRFWDGGLYPLDEQGDHELRSGNLAWLLAQTPALVKGMPVSEDGGISMADFEQARHRAAHAAAPAGHGGQGRQGQGGSAPAGWPSSMEEADAGPTVQELDVQRRRNSEAFNMQLLEQAEYCLAALRELERAVDARLGADGPSFAAAREALQDAVDFVGILAPVEQASEGPAGHGGRGGHAGHHDHHGHHGQDGYDGDPRQASHAAAGGAAAAAAAGAAGALAALSGAAHKAAVQAARAQALAQLRLIADFFRNTEPHSPVAYLLERAAGWGEMPLHEWLAAVVKDPAQSAQLGELLGVAARSE